MKRWLHYGLVWMFIAVSSSYANPVYSVIPQPVNLQPREGFFEITPKTAILVEQSAQRLGETLADVLSPAMGYRLRVGQKASWGSRRIELKLDDSLTELGSEGYTLTVEKKAVTIKAPKENGLFYGIMTLKQLLPPDIFCEAKVEGVQWKVPCVEITDYPRFQWRGMHLDVGRYFMPVEFVKKYIDLIALHKMNVFHWHLTEDQGWRIEIKKYPKLTEVGAWRKETLIGHRKDKPHTFDGKRHGGFYTQDEVRRIVAYAKERFITVVPEIEMPGHSLAALAAYPELSCTGGPFEVKTFWGIEDDVYCAGNDQTIRFLQDILTEVLELFPSEYIHIGGDECRKNNWEQCPKCQARIKAEGLKDEHELQSWFIKQMGQFLDAQDHGLDDLPALFDRFPVFFWRPESTR